MARRRYRKRSLFKIKLRKTTIYTLFSIFSIAVGAGLLASYTRSNVLLSDINFYLISYFGGFSYLVPIDVILLGLLLTRIRAPFTRANVFLGFLLLSVSIIGLFQSGLIGNELFLVSQSIFGNLLAAVIFIAGILVGLVVFLNLSLSQLFDIAKDISDEILKIISNILFVNPLGRIKSP